MGYDKFSKEAVSKTATVGISELDKSNYMQVCSDVINIVEGNYNDEDMKRAYEFAKKEWDRLESETITKVQAVSKTAVEYTEEELAYIDYLDEIYPNCPNYGLLLYRGDPITFRVEMRDWLTERE